MDGIKGLLLRFKHLEPKEPKVVALVQKVIHEVLGVSIPENQITLQRNTVFLSVSHVVKQVLHLKKEALLAKMRESEYGKEVVDIR